MNIHPQTSHISDQLFTRVALIYRKIICQVLTSELTSNKLRCFKASIYIIVKDRQLLNCISLFLLFYYLYKMHLYVYCHVHVISSVVKKHIEFRVFTSKIQDQYKIHLTTDQMFGVKHSKVCTRYKFAIQNRIAKVWTSYAFSANITNFSWSFPVYTYSDFSNHYGIINITKLTHNLSKRTQNSIHL